MPRLRQGRHFVQDDIIKNMKKQLSLIAIPVVVVMLLSSFSPVPAALSKGENNGSGNPDFEMLKGNLPALNQNDLEDNGLGKHLTADDAQKAANNGEVKNPVAPMGADAQMMELMAMIQALQMEIKAMRAELNGMKPAAAPSSAEAMEDKPAEPTIEQQKAAGVIITGGVSGPGYPTGPLNISLPATQLLFDR
ncbi:MAG TPA: hypothetical protein VJB62_02755, partial [Patescibacteria group bacterium]|nr:hypothetical protein [Patescibacteria group bacterium]